MNEKNLADVIILARGGGSLEDLWPFNEEIVARAIFNSKLPVISAVGHETDFTIADFVADLRAPTPSAAAELAVPDIFEVKDKIANYKKRLRVSLLRNLELMRLRYQKCMASAIFKEPTRQIQDKYLRLDTIMKSLTTEIHNKLKQEKSNYVELIAKLDALSPLKTMARGYAIAQKDGKVIKSVSQLNQGDIIDLKLCDGTRQAKVLGGE